MDSTPVSEARDQLAGSVIAAISRTDDTAAQVSIPEVLRGIMAADSRTDSTRSIAPTRSAGVVVEDWAMVAVMAIPWRRAIVCTGELEVVFPMAMLVTSHDLATASVVVGLVAEVMDLVAMADLVSTSGSPETVGDGEEIAGEVAGVEAGETAGAPIAGPGIIPGDPACTESPAGRGITPGGPGWVEVAGRGTIPGVLASTESPAGRGTIPGALASPVPAGRGITLGVPVWVGPAGPSIIRGELPHLLA